MSDITLSNAVRTNLSSLQNTADLLARTQERLSTGNKVNSALDNPVNFFTASGLTERSGDLSNLLDSISNSVQTLQAADEGITSIQSLVDSAKATARQALQAPKSFDSKANVTTAAFEGITEDNLLANPIDTNSSLTGLSSVNNNAALDTTLTERTAAAEATATIRTNNTGNADEFADLVDATEATLSFNYATDLNDIEALANGDTLDFSFTGGDGTVTSVSLEFGQDFNNAAELETAIGSSALGSLVTVSRTGDAFSLEANVGDGFGSFGQIVYTDAGGTDGPDNSFTLNTDNADISTGGSQVATSDASRDSVTLNYDALDNVESLTDGDTIAITYNDNGTSVSQTFTYLANSDGTNGVNFSSLSSLVTAINTNGNAIGTQLSGNDIATDNGDGTITLATDDAANDQITSVVFTDAGAATDGDDKSKQFGSPTAPNVDDSQIVIGFGANQVTYTKVTGGDSNENNTFSDAATLAARINEDFGSGTAVFDLTNERIELTGTSGNYSSSFTVNGGNNTNVALDAGGGVATVAPQAEVLADILTVNGTNYTFVDPDTRAADPTQNEFGTVEDLDALLEAQNIDATFNNGLQLTAQDLETTVEVGGSAASKLFGTSTFAEATASGSNGLAGQTLNVSSDTGSATVTFGSGAGEVSTLEDLNDIINDVGLDASLSDDGELIFETTNQRGLDTLQLSASPAQENQVNISGTIIQSNGALDGASVTAAVANESEADSRADLVNDYNEILQQITDLAADASYNGVNLLNGDDLEVIFNENNTSSLEIEGVVFDAAGLGLSDIQDADFLDSDSINDVLSTLDASTITLRSQASKFGSNLSVVETRQDFTSNLVNVLETGAANLTLADLNEEAANSSALSTRQQIATSALSLATQADQGILQLLR